MACSPGDAIPGSGCVLVGFGPKAEVAVILAEGSILVRSRRRVSRDGLLQLGVAGLIPYGRGVQSWSQNAVSHYSSQFFARPAPQVWALVERTNAVLGD